MEKSNIFKVMLAGLFCAVFSQSLWSQHWTFLDADDDRNRGYYDRPYKRYEAEPEWSRQGGNAVYLPQTFDQLQLQSEASNQQAIRLININDYVAWTNDEAADGMTIRFSLPDAAGGGGTAGTLALYVNDVWVQDIELNSYWAWQYFYTGMRYSYPDNTPATDKFARMRFDEVRVKLADKIPQNAVFKLVKKDHDGIACTVDYVELEPIPARVEQPEGAAVYQGDGSDLMGFLIDRPGQTVYLPEGIYNVPVRLHIVGDGARLTGAGMWYTQLHFTASPQNTGSNPSSPGGYNARGISSQASNIEVSGLYITTANERRYQTYYSNSRQMGKGINGSFGTNSRIHDVWVTHFECGAWFDGTNGLQISHSRFRNNYADGINLSRGSRNATVEHCSFRNNGDDDMASWASGNQPTQNIAYRCNISENNWRAAGLGFFGGRQNKASHLVILDPLEDGIRANNDFDGSPFSGDGFFRMSDISIYRAGGKATGRNGKVGNLWGNRTAAVHLSAASDRYDVKNLIFSNIDIYNSKGNAIMLMGGLSSRAISNVQMTDVTVDGAAVSPVGNEWAYYGLFSEANGNNNLFCINYLNMGDIPETTLSPVASGFVHNVGCEENAVLVRVGQTLDLNEFIKEDFAGTPEYAVITSAENLSADAQGMITGLNEGTAQVKVTDADNPARFAIYNIIIKDIAVTGVNLSDETIELLVRESYRLTAAVIPANATNDFITWKSSDASNSVIRLSFTGLVTGLALGQAVITVTTADGMFTRQCTVKVVERKSDVPAAGADGLIIDNDGSRLQISRYAEGEIISLYNLLGMRVYSQRLTGGETQTVRGLAGGIYIVTAEKAHKKQKVVIKSE